MLIKDLSILVCIISNVYLLVFLILIKMCVSLEIKKKLIKENEDRLHSIGDKNLPTFYMTMRFYTHLLCLT